MNQIEMNRIAMNYIENVSWEVAKKLEKVLVEDLQEKNGQVSGMALHHIHHEAIFSLITLLNSIFIAKDKENSEVCAKEYLKLAHSLKPQFFNIVNELKDFHLSENPDINQDE